MHTYALFFFYLALGYICYSIYMEIGVLMWKSLNIHAWFSKCLPNTCFQLFRPSRMVCRREIYISLLAREYWSKKNPGKNGMLADNYSSKTLGKRRCSCAAAPENKVGTFPIKRARVRKKISLWSGHVSINLTLSAVFMLKTTIKRFILRRRKCVDEFEEFLR